MNEHHKLIETIEADIQPIRLSFVKLKRQLENTAARHQVILKIAFSTINLKKPEFENPFRCC